MLSALARPAGAALRRSFSTSAQVGPARGSLQVEAPRPRPRVFLAREQPCPRVSRLGPQGRLVQTRSCVGWVGPDTGREVRGRKSRNQGGGK